MALARGINLMTPEGRSHENLAAASFLSPTGQCRPFDASADGYRRGEGAGFVLLKKLSAAVADSDRILGVVTASAVNNSKGSRSITLPSSASQTALYHRVIGMAGLHPSQISYVETHGTGTRKGDPVEFQSIQSVFGGRCRTPEEQPLRLGSVKGHLGHCEAASGVASLAKVLLMLQHSLVPPQANFSTPNPAILSLDEANMHIPVHSEPWKGNFRAALVNNYGASGTNAAMVVCQHLPAPIKNTPKPCQYPILVTAHSTGSLNRYCHSLLSLIESQHATAGENLLPSVAFHLGHCQNQSHPYRVRFSTNSIEELEVYLRSQIHEEVKPRSKPVVLLFAGQTGRRSRLSRDMYDSSLLLQHHLDRCDRTLQTLGYRSLFPHIFDTDILDDLVDLHCMQFSLQYSVAASWIDAGLEVKALVGHSLGQLTALCVSGVLTLHDALKMVSGRAMLIQTRWGAERGSMLSIDADADTVHAMAETMPMDVDKIEIACYNASSHQVVVGTEAAVTAFEKRAVASGCSVKWVHVTHGFHSRMVDCILSEYQQLIQGLTLHPPTIPIEPCSQSPRGWANITPELIARQSREPVYFADAVSRLEKRLGYCVWLEAGSSSAGITMARRALANKPSSPCSSSHTFHSPRLDGPDAIDVLADTTLGLWSEGIRVQFWLYHTRQRHCFMPLELPSYQFEKSQHWLPFSSNHGSTSDERPSTHHPPKLVTLMGTTLDSSAHTVEFSINQDSEEYSTFVQGRTVFGQLLAPGSVYVESATRAFAMLPIHRSSLTALTPGSIQVERVRLHSPFGLDLQRCLRLTLRKGPSSSWDFIVESYSPNDTRNKASKLQASGTIKQSEEVHSYLLPGRPMLRRLYERCENILDDRSASVVQGAFVKKILGQVANYADSYLAIRSMTSKGLEAVGIVETPIITSQCGEGALIVPPLFDNFLLVAELHANSLGDLAHDHLYICSGFDSITLQDPAGNSPSKPTTQWTVHSSLDQENDKTVVCDIFVFNPCLKTLHLTIIGARFTQVPILSLQKALGALDHAGRGRNQPTLDSNTSGENSMLGIWATSAIPTVATSNTTGLEDFNLDPLIPEGRHGSVMSLPQLTPDYASDDSSGLSSNKPLSTAGVDTLDHEQDRTALLNLLSEHLNFSQGISPDTPLGVYGLDSLVAIQLQSDMERLCGKRLGPLEIDENSTLSDLCGMMFDQSLASEVESSPLRDNSDTNLSNKPPDHTCSHVIPITVAKSIPHQDPAATLVSKATLEFSHINQETGLFAQKTGFDGFFSSVYQDQMSLVLTYILEAFRSQGCDLRILHEGDLLPPITHVPKYQRLVSRFHDILEAAGLITISAGSRPHQLSLRRTATPLPEARPSADVYHELLAKFPLYRPDHELLNITGSHLAEFLSGQEDPLRLLFREATSLQILTDVYVSSPMFATGNTMLGEFLRRVVSKRSHAAERVQILEVGAGTGATTRHVLDVLLACDVDFTYTFTDVSAALVANARKELGPRYNHRRPRCNIEFAVLDIEKPPPSTPGMLHANDLVISSNCVHATRNLRQSCANVEKLLRKDNGGGGGGMLCLLELTRPLPWLDCVFGLLDGWWRFDDGRTYALADESQWKTVLLDAGFKHVDWTSNRSRESQQFQLITAWR